MVEGRYKPVKVTASASTGIATSIGCDPKTEDTITLLVDWQNVNDDKQRGTAVYTASWAAPLKAGVHSEQRFHYMASKGEVRVDQAHRGYSVVEDDIGKLDVSVMAWGDGATSDPSTTPSTSNTRPTRTATLTVNAVTDTSRWRSLLTPLRMSRPAEPRRATLRARVCRPSRLCELFEFPVSISLTRSVLTTAIIHAGRISLDEKRTVEIKEDGGKWKLV